MENQYFQNEYQSIFSSLDRRAAGRIYKRDIIQVMEENGVLLEGLRIQQKLDEYTSEQPIQFFEFIEIIQKNMTLFKKAARGELVLKNFNSFSKKVSQIYEDTIQINSGAVASYIPELKRVNPNEYAVSICSIDSQQIHLGSVDTPFCIQSTCKPINYCLAVDEHTSDYVHQYVGREPSGRGFNELTLNSEGLPHNPMINSGGIMSCSLIQPQLSVNERVAYVLSKWESLSGGFFPGLNQAVYLSEKETADRNFALGYMMKEKKAFPKNVNLEDVLDFYFQSCAIEQTTKRLSVVAATLANSGVCPITGNRVLESSTVKNCLSLMLSCGMYDYSGEFAFNVGLPAKSGVSGVLMVVIPNVMGLAIWSPRLDLLGNSVRGVSFCKQLIENFNFHIYDSLLSQDPKYDPRRPQNEKKVNGVRKLFEAVRNGNINEIRQLSSQGIDLNSKNYDFRTAVHIAATENQVEVLQYFIEHSVVLTTKDRWGNTPLDDAKRNHNEDAVKLLLTFD